MFFSFREMETLRIKRETRFSLKLRFSEWKITVTTRNANSVLSPFRNKRNKHNIVETPSNATSNRCLHFHPHQTFIFRGNNFSVACKWHDISHFYRAASAWRPPSGISITEIAWFAYPTTTTYRENAISSRYDKSMLAVFQSLVPLRKSLHRKKKRKVYDIVVNHRSKISDIRRRLLRTSAREWGREGGGGSGEEESFRMGNSSGI